MKNNIYLLVASLASAQAFAIQEIPDSSINDAAIASIENGETVIRYNPENCGALGDQICKFYLSHEYGHIALGHQIGEAYTIEEEYAADCWVTQNAPEHLAKAAYVYFMNEGEMNGWAYGSGTQRAENISECPEAAVSEKPDSSANSDNQKKGKSHFNHFWADAVFADIEGQYPSIFPYSGTYAWEYLTSNGGITYDKKYYNGSALSEENGHLFYKLFGGVWYLWGPISQWRI